MLDYSSLAMAQGIATTILCFSLLADDYVRQFGTMLS